MDWCPLWFGRLNPALHEHQGVSFQQPIDWFVSSLRIPKKKKKSWNLCLSGPLWGESGGFHLQGAMRKAFPYHDVIKEYVTNHIPCLWLHPVSLLCVYYKRSFICNNFFRYTCKVHNCALTRFVLFWYNDALAGFSHILPSFFSDTEVIAVLPPQSDPWPLSPKYRSLTGIGTPL